MGCLGGLWEFPGGKQQEGEDLPTCLRREICEELGAEIEVGRSLGFTSMPTPIFESRLYAFRCYSLGGEPRPIQAADVRWVSPQELSQLSDGEN